MYNLDDKDIDRISRNAAENYQAPGGPSWDALQKTLDIELPREKEKKRRGFIFFFLLAGLFVTGSLYWYGRQATAPAVTIAADKKNQGGIENKDKNISSRQINNPKQESPNQNKNTDKNIPAESAVSSKKQTASKKDQKTIPVTERTNDNPVKPNGTYGNNDYHPEKSFNHPGTRQPLAKNITPINKRKQQVLVANSNTSNPLLKRKNNKTTATGKIKTSNFNNDENLKDAEATTGSTTNDHADTHAPNNLMRTATGIDSTAKTIAGNNKEVASADIKSIPPDTATGKKDSAKTADKKNKEQKNKKAYNIGLTAGLDMSTVKYTHSDNPGFNIGLLGGYQFNKNWSVYTGLIYTKKNYHLNGADYHPPVHYWTSYVDLQSVEGYCRMWEVPLLARYTFNSKSDKHFFVSTGLSSYFMKKQQYNYSYKIINTGAVGNSAWANDSSFNHIFSILHISAGFEKRLGKNLNWQIEPYAKIPLGGVGFGNIKLSSFGINFSIQYRHTIKQ